MEKRGRELESFPKKVVEGGAEGGVSDRGEPVLQRGEKASMLGSSAKDKRDIQQLDEKIFQLWDGCSRSCSDLGIETAIRKGGLLNTDCGNPVRNGQEGVQCDYCSGWFHDTCQGIEVPAIRALDRFKILSWLCVECKCAIKRKMTQEEWQNLNRKWKIWIRLSASA